MKYLFLLLFLITSNNVPESTAQDEQTKAEEKKAPDKLSMTGTNYLHRNEHTGWTKKSTAFKMMTEYRHWQDMSTKRRLNISFVFGSSNRSSPRAPFSGREKNLTESQRLFRTVGLRNYSWQGVGYSTNHRMITRSSSSFSPTNFSRMDGLKLDRINHADSAGGRTLGEWPQDVFGRDNSSSQNPKFSHIGSAMSPDSRSMSQGSRLSYYKNTSLPGVGSRSIPEGTQILRKVYFGGLRAIPVIPGLRSMAGSRHLHHDDDDDDHGQILKPEETKPVIHRRMICKCVQICGAFHSPVSSTSKPAKTGYSDKTVHMSTRNEVDVDVFYDDQVEEFSIQGDAHGDNHDFHMTGLTRKELATFLTGKGTCFEAHPDEVTATNNIMQRLTTLPRRRRSTTTATTIRTTQTKTRRRRTKTTTETTPSTTRRRKTRSTSTTTVAPTTTKKRRRKTKLPTVFTTTSTIIEEAESTTNRKRRRRTTPPQTHLPTLISTTAQTKTISHAQTTATAAESPKHIIEPNIAAVGATDADTTMTETAVKTTMKVTTAHATAPSRKHIIESNIAAFGATDTDTTVNMESEFSTDMTSSTEITASTETSTIKAKVVVTQQNLTQRVTMKPTTTTTARRSSNVSFTHGTPVATPSKATEKITSHTTTNSIPQSTPATKGVTLTPEKTTSAELKYTNVSHTSTLTPSTAGKTSAWKATTQSNFLFQNASTEEPSTIELTSTESTSIQASTLSEVSDATHTKTTQPLMIKPSTSSLVPMISLHPSSSAKVTNAQNISLSVPQFEQTRLSTFRLDLTSTELSTTSQASSSTESKKETTINDFNVSGMQTKIVTKSPTKSSAYSTGVIKTTTAPVTKTSSSTSQKHTSHKSSPAIATTSFPKKASTEVASSTPSVNSDKITSPVQSVHTTTGTTTKNDKTTLSHTTIQTSVAEQASSATTNNEAISQTPVTTSTESSAATTTSTIIASIQVPEIARNTFALINVLLNGTIYDNKYISTQQSFTMQFSTGNKAESSYNPTTASISRVTTKRHISSSIGTTKRAASAVETSKGDLQNTTLKTTGESKGIVSEAFTHASTWSSDGSSLPLYDETTEFYESLTSQHSSSTSTSAPSETLEHTLNLSKSQSFQPTSPMATDRKSTMKSAGSTGLSEKKTPSSYASKLKSSTNVPFWASSILTSSTPTAKLYTKPSVSVSHTSRLRFQTSKKSSGMTSSFSQSAPVIVSSTPGLTTTSTVSPSASTGRVPPNSATKQDIKTKSALMTSKDARTSRLPVRTSTTIISISPESSVTTSPSTSISLSLLNTWVKPVLTTKRIGPSDQPTITLNPRSRFTFSKSSQRLTTKLKASKFSSSTSTKNESLHSQGSTATQIKTTSDRSTKSVSTPTLLSTSKAHTISNSRSPSPTMPPRQTSTTSVRPSRRTTDLSLQTTRAASTSSSTSEVTETSESDYSTDSITESSDETTDSSESDSSTTGSPGSESSTPSSSESTSEDEEGSSTQPTTEKNHKCDNMRKLSSAETLLILSSYIVQTKDSRACSGAWWESLEENLGNEAVMFPQNVRCGKENWLYGVSKLLKEATSDNSQVWWNEQGNDINITANETRKDWWEKQDTLFKVLGSEALQHEWRTDLERELNQTDWIDTRQGMKQIKELLSKIYTNSASTNYWWDLVREVCVISASSKSSNFLFIGNTTSFTPTMVTPSSVAVPLRTSAQPGQSTSSAGAHSAKLTATNSTHNSLIESSTQSATNVKSPNNSVLPTTLTRHDEATMKTEKTTFISSERSKANSSLTKSLTAISSTSSSHSLKTNSLTLRTQGSYATYSSFKAQSGTSSIQSSKQRETSASTVTPSAVRSTQSKYSTRASVTVPSASVSAPFDTSTPQDFFSTFFTEPGEKSSSRLLSEEPSTSIFAKRNTFNTTRSTAGEGSRHSKGFSMMTSSPATKKLANITSINSKHTTELSTTNAQTTAAPITTKSLSSFTLHIETVKLSSASGGGYNISTLTSVTKSQATGPPKQSSTTPHLTATARPEPTFNSATTNFVSHSTDHVHSTAWTTRTTRYTKISPAVETTTESIAVDMNSTISYENTTKLSTTSETTPQPLDEDEYYDENGEVTFKLTIDMTAFIISKLILQTHSSVPCYVEWWYKIVKEADSGILDDSSTTTPLWKVVRSIFTISNVTEGWWWNHVNETELSKINDPWWRQVKLELEKLMISVSEREAWMDRMTKTLRQIKETDIHDVKWWEEIEGTFENISSSSSWTDSWWNDVNTACNSLIHSEVLPSSVGNTSLSTLKPSSAKSSSTFMFSTTTLPSTSSESTPEQLDEDEFYDGNGEVRNKLTIDVTSHVISIYIIQSGNPISCDATWWSALVKSANKELIDNNSTATSWWKVVASIFTETNNTHGRWWNQFNKTELTGSMDPWWRQVGLEFEKLRKSSTEREAWTQRLQANLQQIKSTTMHDIKWWNQIEESFEIISSSPEDLISWWDNVNKVCDHKEVTQSSTLPKSPHTSHNSMNVVTTTVGSSTRGITNSHRTTEKTLLSSITGLTTKHSDAYVTGATFESTWTDSTPEPLDEDEFYDENGEVKNKLTIDMSTLIISNFIIQTKDDVACNADWWTTLLDIAVTELSSGNSTATTWWKVVASLFTTPDVTSDGRWKRFRETETSSIKDPWWKQVGIELDKLRNDPSERNAWKERLQMTFQQIKLTGMPDVTWWKSVEELSSEILKTSSMTNNWWESVDRICRPKYHATTAAHTISSKLIFQSPSTQQLSMKRPSSLLDSYTKYTTTSFRVSQTTGLSLIESKSTNSTSNQNTIHIPSSTEPTLQTLSKITSKPADRTNWMKLSTQPTFIRKSWTHSTPQSPMTLIEESPTPSSAKPTKEFTLPLNATISTAVIPPEVTMATYSRPTTSESVTSHPKHVTHLSAQGSSSVTTMFTPTVPNYNEYTTSSLAFTFSDSTPQPLDEDEYYDESNEVQKKLTIDTTTLIISSFIIQTQDPVACNISWWNQLVDAADTTLSSDNATPPWWNIVASIFTTQNWKENGWWKGINKTETLNKDPWWRQVGIELDKLKNDPLDREAWIRRLTGTFEQIKRTTTHVVKWWDKVEQVLDNISSSPQSLNKWWESLNKVCDLIIETHQHNPSSHTPKSQIHTTEQQHRTSTIHDSMITSNSGHDKTSQQTTITELIFIANTSQPASKITHARSFESTLHSSGPNSNHQSRSSLPHTNSHSTKLTTASSSHSEFHAWETSTVNLEVSTPEPLDEDEFYDENGEVQNKLTVDVTVLIISNIIIESQSAIPCDVSWWNHLIANAETLLEHDNTTTVPLWKVVTSIFKSSTVQESALWRGINNTEFSKSTDLWWRQVGIELDKLKTDSTDREVWIRRLRSTLEQIKTTGTHEVKWWGKVEQIFEKVSSSPASETTWWEDVDTVCSSKHTTHPLASTYQTFSKSLASAFPAERYTIRDKTVTNSPILRETSRESTISPTTTKPTPQLNIATSSVTTHVRIPSKFHTWETSTITTTEEFSTSTPLDEDEFYDENGEVQNKLTIDISTLIISRFIIELKDQAACSADWWKKLLDTAGKYDLVLSNGTSTEWWKVVSAIFTSTDMTRDGWWQLVNRTVSPSSNDPWWRQIGIELDKLRTDSSEREAWMERLKSTLEQINKTGEHVVKWWGSVEVAFSNMSASSESIANWWQHVNDICSSVSQSYVATSNYSTLATHAHSSSSTNLKFFTSATHPATHYSEITTKMPSTQSKYVPNQISTTTAASPIEIDEYVDETGGVQKKLSKSITILIILTYIIQTGQFEACHSRWWNKLEAETSAPVYSIHKGDAWWKAVETLMTDIIQNNSKGPWWKANKTPKDTPNITAGAWWINKQKNDGSTAASIAENSETQNEIANKHISNSALEGRQSWWDGIWAHIESLQSSMELRKDWLTDITKTLTRIAQTEDKRIPWWKTVKAAFDQIESSESSVDEWWSKVNNICPTKPNPTHLLSSEGIDSIKTKLPTAFLITTVPSTPYSVKPSESSEKEPEIDEYVDENGDIQKKLSIAITLLIASTYISHTNNSEACNDLWWIALESGINQSTPSDVPGDAWWRVVQTLMGNNESSEGNNKWWKTVDNWSTNLSGNKQVAWWKNSGKGKPDITANNAQTEILTGEILHDETRQSWWNHAFDLMQKLQQSSESRKYWYMSVSKSMEQIERMENRKSYWWTQVQHSLDQFKGSAGSIDTYWDNVNSVCQQNTTTHFVPTETQTTNAAPTPHATTGGATALSAIEISSESELNFDEYVDTDTEIQKKLSISITLLITSTYIHQTHNTEACGYTWWSDLENKHTESTYKIKHGDSWWRTVEEIMSDAGNLVGGKNLWWRNMHTGISVHAPGEKGRWWKNAAGKLRDKRQSYDDSRLNWWKDSFALMEKLKTSSKLRRSWFSSVKENMQSIEKSGGDRSGWWDHVKAAYDQIKNSEDSVDTWWSKLNKICHLNTASLPPVSEPVAAAMMTPSLITLKPPISEREHPDIDEYVDDDGKVQKKLSIAITLLLTSTYIYQTSNSDACTETWWLNLEDKHKKSHSSMKYGDSWWKTMEEVMSDAFNSDGNKGAWWKSVNRGLSTPRSSGKGSWWKNSERNLHEKRENRDISRESWWQHAFTLMENLRKSSEARRVWVASVKKAMESIEKSGGDRVEWWGNVENAYDQIKNTEDSADAWWRRVSEICQLNADFSTLNKQTDMTLTINSLPTFPSTISPTKSLAEQPDPDEYVGEDGTIQKKLSIAITLLITSTYIYQTKNSAACSDTWWLNLVTHDIRSNSTIHHGYLWWKTVEDIMSYGQKNNGNRQEWWKNVNETPSTLVGGDIESALTWWKQAFNLMEKLRKSSETRQFWFSSVTKTMKSIEKTDGDRVHWWNKVKVAYDQIKNSEDSIDMWWSKVDEICETKTVTYSPKGTSEKAPSVTLSVTSTFKGVTLTPTTPTAESPTPPEDDLEVDEYRDEDGNIQKKLSIAITLLITSTYISNMNNYEACSSIWWSDLENNLANKSSSSQGDVWWKAVDQIMSAADGNESIDSWWNYVGKYSSTNKNITSWKGASNQQREKLESLYDESRISWWSHAFSLMEKLRTNSQARKFWLKSVTATMEQIERTDNSKASWWPQVNSAFEKVKAGSMDKYWDEINQICQLDDASKLSVVETQIANAGIPHSMVETTNVVSSTESAAEEEEPGVDEYLDEDGNVQKKLSIAITLFITSTYISRTNNSEACSSIWWSDLEKNLANKSSSSQGDVWWKAVDQIMSAADGNESIDSWWKYVGKDSSTNKNSTSWKGASNKQREKLESLYDESRISWWSHAFSLMEKLRTNSQARKFWLKSVTATMEQIERTDNSKASWWPQVNSAFEKVKAGSMDKYWDEINQICQLDDASKLSVVETQIANAGIPHSMVETTNLVSSTESAAEKEEPGVDEYLDEDGNVQKKLSIAITLFITSTYISRTNNSEACSSIWWSDLEKNLANKSSSSQGDVWWKAVDQIMSAADGNESIDSWWKYVGKDSSTNKNSTSWKGASNKQREKLESLYDESRISWWSHAFSLMEKLRTNSQARKFWLKSVTTSMEQIERTDDSKVNWWPQVNSAFEKVKAGSMDKYWDEINQICQRDDATKLSVVETQIANAGIPHSMVETTNVVSSTESAAEEEEPGVDEYLDEDGNVQKKLSIAITLLITSTYIIRTNNSEACSSIWWTNLESKLVKNSSDSQGDMWWKALEIIMTNFSSTQTIGSWWRSIDKESSSDSTGRNGIWWKSAGKNHREKRQILHDESRTSWWNHAFSLMDKLRNAGDARRFWYASVQKTMERIEQANGNEVLWWSQIKAAFSQVSSPESWWENIDHICTQGHQSSPTASTTPAFEIESDEYLDEDRQVRKKLSISVLITATYITQTNDSSACSGTWWNKFEAAQSTANSSRNSWWKTIENIMTDNTTSSDSRTAWWKSVNASKRPKRSWWKKPGNETTGTHTLSAENTSAQTSYNAETHLNDLRQPWWNDVFNLMLQVRNSADIRRTWYAEVSKTIGRISRSEDKLVGWWSKVKSAFEQVGGSESSMNDWWARVENLCSKQETPSDITYLTTPMPELEIDEYLDEYRVPRKKLGIDVTVLVVMNHVSSTKNDKACNDLWWRDMELKTDNSSSGDALWKTVSSMFSSNTSQLSRSVGRGVNTSIQSTANQSTRPTSLPNASPRPRSVLKTNTTHSPPIKKPTPITAKKSIPVPTKKALPPLPSTKKHTPPAPNKIGKSLRKVRRRHSRSLNTTREAWWKQVKTTFDQVISSSTARQAWWNNVKQAFESIRATSTPHPSWWKKIETIYDQMSSSTARDNLALQTSSICSMLSGRRTQTTWYENFERLCTYVGRSRSLALHWWETVPRAQYGGAWWKFLPPKGEKPGKKNWWKGKQETAWWEQAPRVYGKMNYTSQFNEAWWKNVEQYFSKINPSTTPTNKWWSRVQVLFGEIDTTIGDKLQKNPTWISNMENICFNVRLQKPAVSQQWWNNLELVCRQVQLSNQRVGWWTVLPKASDKVDAYNNSGGAWWKYHWTVSEIIGDNRDFNSSFWLQIDASFSQLDDSYPPSNEWWGNIRTIFSQYNGSSKEDWQQNLENTCKLTGRSKVPQTDGWQRFARMCNRISHHVDSGGPWWEVLTKETLETAADRWWISGQAHTFQQTWWQHPQSYFIHSNLPAMSSQWWTKVENIFARLGNSVAQGPTESWWKEMESHFLKDLKGSSTWWQTVENVCGGISKGNWWKHVPAAGKQTG